MSGSLGERVGEMRLEENPNVIGWIERKHGKVGYFLNQLLTGHRFFQEYLCRMALAEDDRCVYCEERVTQ